MDEPQLPEGNVHTFLFPSTSNPLPVNRQIVVPDDKPLFYSYLHNATLTYGRVREDSLRFAAGLASAVSTCSAKGDLGVKGSIVGPVVMIHLPNCIMYSVIMLGALATRCTVTLTNPILTPTEVAHILQQIQPDVVFTQPGPSGETIVESAIGLVPGIQKPRIFTVDTSDYPFALVKGHSSPSTNSWATLLMHNQSYTVAPMSREEQARKIGIILWSSGTTGKSKGVLLSHQALIAHPIVLKAGNPGFTTDERWIGFAPFFHVYGLMNVLLFAPYMGAFVIVMPKFNFEAFLRLISKHKVTNLHIAPPVAVALAKSPLVDQPWCDLRSAKTATSGGAPLGSDIIREVQKRTGIVVKMGYGLSETGTVTSTPEDDWPSVEPQLGASGRPVPGQELKIVDESGKALPRGERGEILCRSKFQMAGYVNNPEATAQAIDAEGFVHTGDIGIIDERNCLFIVDRLKEVIKYKGFQVSPAELDAIIGGLQTVQDVGVASIYSDAQATELPLAYVVPRSPELQTVIKTDPRASTNKGLLDLASQIRKTVEDKCVYYKWLRGGIIFCDAVPRSASGKIVRRSLNQVQGVHVPCYASPASKAKL